MPRPLPTYHGFVGQADTVRSMKDHCRGSLSKSQPLPHVLFMGPSGMGKTELAKCVAKDMGVGCHDFFASPASKRWQLAKHFMQVKKGDIVFIDEIHALQDSVQEVLYPAIDRHEVPLVDERNRIVENEWLPIPAFTLIAASDQVGKLKNALLQRMSLRFCLRDYTEAEMKIIVANRAAATGILLSPQAAKRIGKASRGVPRRARHLLQSLHTCLEDTHQTVTVSMANKHLKSVGIDKDDLTDHDRLYLGILARRGGFVSLESIAIQLSLDGETVMRQVEPFLTRMELISVDRRGRTLTDKGIRYVKSRRLA